MEMFDVGLPDLWYKRHQSFTGHEMIMDISQVDTSYKTLTLRDMIGIFMLYAIGIAVSFIGMIVEYLILKEIKWRVCHNIIQWVKKY